ncbi:MULTISPECIES: T9SS type A sorting domain-containing protein [unclassified Polaribacter]|uniref:T9SS type A sorting domain-containing protein n=1 Tax=unclassified Polaribacter TaxID=196858 RepID=UPI0011BEEE22|nr:MULTISPECIES: T9SS type A sorting domain-containing protein [unclassified Polaribacter]TXD51144.1 T9SS type A sorting domain-containing protein [Polaribacter sp. IC063]TXD56763.1 T9SS type A sorting domain-containing protein [Polaribacter sp. IC066]
MKKITLKALQLSLCFLAIPFVGQVLDIESGSELYVQPGSYLYVSQGINVKAGGALTLDSNATLSASLLVQGATTGNITYLRNVPNANWHVLSAPVAGASIQGFIDDTDNAIAKNGSDLAGIGPYENTNASGERWAYVSASGNTGNFVNGKGYTFKRTASGVYNFTGTHASTTANTTIALVPGGSGAASATDNWYAVGNPYPAFLAVADILNVNVNAFDEAFKTLHVWNGTSYEIANLISDSPVKQILPGQAFLVKMKDASQTFLFNTFDRTHQTNQTGLTLNKGAKDNFIKIDLTLTSGANQRSTAIYYLNENATLGLDPGYDAGAYEEGTPSFTLATHLVENSKGINFAIQALPNTSLETTIVPLSVNALKGEVLDFSIQSKNLETGIDTYIEDKMVASFTKIDATNNFSVTLAKDTKGAGRFYLHTSSKSLSATDAVTASSLHFYKTTNNTLKIVGLTNAENTTVTLFNVLGKQVFTESFVADSNQTIALPSSLATGVYIAKVNQNTAQLTKKIIID